MAAYLGPSGNDEVVPGDVVAARPRGLRLQRLAHNVHRRDARLQFHFNACMRMLEHHSVCTQAAKAVCVSVLPAHRLFRMAMTHTTL